MKKIALRVDVDFEICLTKGVPFLLDYFREKNIKATFYVTMGPDGFRHNRKRIKTSGYVRRIMNFNPLSIISKFGLKYLLKQFVGFNDNVGKDHPAVIKRIIQEGHEIGVHGYDHFWWAENVWSCAGELVKEDIERGFYELEYITGTKPTVWASPNWRCSCDSLNIVEMYNVIYGADSRGRYPFRAICNGGKSEIIQMPISLPCLHEIKGYLNTKERKSVIKEFLANVENAYEGYNLWCIHGYYEGLLERQIFMQLYEDLSDNGYRIVSVKELYESINRNEVPYCEIEKKMLPGGRGEVSCQKY